RHGRLVPALRRPARVAASRERGDAAVGYGLRTARGDHDPSPHPRGDPRIDAPSLMTLSSSFPVVLFPIRLETRFVDAGNATELRVRIFPDQIHVDTHEPGLTDSERTALAAWTASARDLPAWRELVARVGATRASYLVTVPKSPDPGRRDD